MGAKVTIVYQAEHIADIQAELQVLAELEYAELGQPFPLVPDWQRLRDLESSGKVFMLTVRDGDIDGAASLIGANVMIVDTHIHYASTKVAFNDAIFLRAEHRRGRIGSKLIQYTEFALKSHDVQAIYYHAKPSNNLGALLNSMGYGACETVHRKVVA